MKKYNNKFILLLPVFILELVFLTLMKEKSHISDQIYVLCVWLVAATTILLFFAFWVKKRLQSYCALQKVLWAFFALVWMIGLIYSILYAIGLDINKWFFQWAEQWMWHI